MNFDKYIGLPYQENGRTWQGVDCWGLARLFYKDEFDVDLPDYSDLYTGSWDEQVTKLINAHKDTWIETQEPNIGDLCLFNIYGEPAHVGVYVGDNKFLHSRDGSDSAIESLSSVVWKKRFSGFYKHQKTETIHITGAPHPLRLSNFTDEIKANSTLQDVVDYINDKYSVDKKQIAKLILMVDGVPIPSELWPTTKIKHDQNISYRVLAEGRGNGRLLVAFAVFVVVTLALSDPATAAKVASAIGVESAATAKLIVTAAAMTATAVLQNVIAPIRPPGMGKDPGQPNQLNLFNGSSNQINRLGAIPIVLGKVRYAGLLGATPFIETNPSTNILNLLIIWGFGPLYVDPKTISVGASNLEESFYDGSTVSVEGGGIPVRTLMGSKDETNEQREQFNKLYPTDVEQTFKNVELTNNPTDGNDWVEAEFLQQGTRVDIAFSFPEGMRAIKSKGEGAGEIAEATCALEIQVVPYNQAFEDVAPLSVGENYSEIITVQPRIVADSESAVSTPMYRWYDFCIGPGGVITYFAGTPTEDPNQQPSQSVVNSYAEQSYASLVNSDTASLFGDRFATIPAGYFRLYRVCIGSGSGVVANTLVNYMQAGTYTGLQFTAVGLTTPGFDEGLTPVATGQVKVTITAGRYYPESAPVDGEPTTTTIFRTSPQSVPNTNDIPDPDKYWSPFLKEHGIWSGNVTELNRTVQVTLTKPGVYNFAGSADDEAVITLGPDEVLNIPGGGYKTLNTASAYFTPGTYPLTIVAKNSGGGAAGIAFEITYTSNAGPNAPASPKTIFTVGTNGVFSRKKDAFNYVYSLPILPRARYKLRVRRADPEIQETPESEYRHFTKVIFSNAICYDNKLPINELPRGRLAKTAIKVQSNSKNNGQVDGINAVVHTMFWDWDRTANQWKFKTTNNPASLFLYVLTHPANAYRLGDPDSPTFYTDIATKVDIPKLVEWHNFCNPAVPTANNPTLTFNAVLTSTQSIMDTLRDICAAGKASPIFLDGKWSVVIDKPRDFVVQHFTPHNSWGFEATKTLPRLPHAFRVTIQDEENAYQAKEIYVYNYGYSQYGEVANTAAAEIFEELSLPGVTNEAQATHLARWHLAQLKLRPETYTINTDFEYLVCNRGDLVKVTHDVPLWGRGSGRIKSINLTTKTIVLTESIPLAANPSPAANYKIRIRTNTASSVYLTLTRITQAGYYDTITVVESIPTSVEVDNLFMLGDENYETQDLIVLAVEPSSNLSARITLTDYSPQIYTANLATDLLKFSPNITKPTTGIVETTITEKPTIDGILSNRSTSRQISIGTYETGAVISFSNPGELTKYAKYVQFELVRGDEHFNSTAPASVNLVLKEVGNYAVFGLETGTIYKVRARYADTLGSVFGPWSDQVSFVGGPAGAETVPATLELKLEGTYIVAYPKDFDLPNDFKTYEYRIKKDTGTEDFWALDPEDPLNGVQVTQSIVEGRFNIMDQLSPRLSETGVTYKVACRVVTRTNEYSETSAVDTIVVTTIRYAT